MHPNFYLCLQGKGEVITWWLNGENNPDFPDFAPRMVWRHLRVTWRQDNRLSLPHRARISRTRACRACACANCCCDVTSQTFRPRFSFDLQSLSPAIDDVTPQRCDVMTVANIAMTHASRKLQLSTLGSQQTALQLRRCVTLLLIYVKDLLAFVLIYTLIKTKATV